MIELKVILDCDNWDEALPHVSDLLKDSLVKKVSFRTSVSSSEFEQRVHEIYRLTDASYSQAFKLASGLYICEEDL